MKKVIFHIGNHKTGTSTLQKFLFKNHIILKKYNLLYSNIGIKFGDYGHHNLSYELGNFSQYDSKYGDYKKFIKIIKQNNDKNILVSSENFECLEFNKKFERFIREIKNLKLKIIVIFFFRNKVSLYQSMIAELVKSGFYFENKDHPQIIESIKKNKYFEYNKHRYWFNKKKEIEMIKKNFKIKTSNIFCIQYRSNKTISLFLDKILEKKIKKKFWKENLIFPKNVNVKNGYYKTLNINLFNKFKALIANMGLNNLIITLISLISVLFKILYVSFLSSFFENNQKKFLKKEHIFELKKI